MHFGVSYPGGRVWWLNTEENLKTEVNVFLLDLYVRFIVYKQQTSFHAIAKIVDKFTQNANWNASVLFYLKLEKRLFLIFW